MRWLLVVGVVILTVLLWQLRSEVAAPVADDHGAAREAEETDDDPVDPDDDTLAPAAEHPHHDHLTSKRAVAAATPVKPYDPWADPGPLDPLVPHLDVDTTVEDTASERRHMMMGVFRTEVVRSRSAIRRCYRDSKLDTDLKLVLGVRVMPDGEGKPIIKPYVHSETDLPLPPELVSCIGDLITGMDLPATVEEGWPYEAVTTLRLSHDTVD